MTPFDPVALVAMLNAFYHDVTPANLALARADRPEYFAAGVLFGSKGDKLRLPDGRVYDCIVNAGLDVSRRSWSAQLVDPTATGADDPFALTEGPLVPLDDTFVFPARDPGAFTALVAGELAPLEHDDGILAAAAQPAVEFTGAQDLDDSFAREIEPADQAHGATLAALDGDPISDVLEANAGGATVIETTAGDYNEPEPPDIPEPDPGDGPEPEKPPPPDF